MSTEVGQLPKIEVSETDPTEQEEESDTVPKVQLDPKKTDAIAESQFKQKYGFKKAPTGMAQRKISATGGKQYFDSGDYASANNKEKKEIASHPHAMNPHLAQMRAKAHVHRTQQSKLLAKGNIKSPLAQ